MHAVHDTHTHTHAHTNTHKGKNTHTYQMKARTRHPPPPLSVCVCVCVCGTDGKDSVNKCQKRPTRQQKKPNNAAKETYCKSDRGLRGR